MFHRKDLDQFREKRKTALNAASRSKAEMRALRNDGRVPLVLIRYNPFRNEQGQLTRWYATGTDIDDRVKARTRHARKSALREQIDRDSMFEDIVGFFGIVAQEYCVRVTRLRLPIRQF